ncbi:MAG: DUF362 domain-containing protein, partial [Myxococcales bacterium]|nr:DUF362 domain-containing protein [Myxococcales bacterium]
MGKNKKPIGRRDFMRVVSGTLVTAELASLGCGEADPTETAGTEGVSPGGNAPANAASSSSAVVPNAAAGSGGATPVPSAASMNEGLPAPAGVREDGEPESPDAPNGLGEPETDPPAANDPMPASPQAQAEGPAGSDGPRATDPVPETDEPTATPGGGQSPDGKSRVYIVKTNDRSEGISEALSLFGGLGFAASRDVVLKPNFNSQYPFPATTHDDTLRTIVAELQSVGAGNITLAESAGATTGSRTPTATVIQAKGTMGLCSELGIEFLSYDEPEVEWETFEFDGMSWRGGLAIPSMMRSSDRVKILLPCCKTHVLADYTFSLKLAAGLPPRSRRGLISDMHTSVHQKVVDINKGFEPDLVVMDAMQCFIDNGPDTGTTRSPGLIVAATDRVALDAVGVAILKSAGSRTTPLRRKIFETPQITRAVEIGLGASSPDEIELVGNDETTLSELRSILDVG